ncbi:reverse transcriptase [Senna tora]|uniref:Reverse transcriptase n=1 Tax=Senna tora TaxID=362788 RepID=A0A835CAY2_9FABA|nr:reverse transcriptase [Senna tora]
MVAKIMSNLVGDVSRKGGVKEKPPDSCRKKEVVVHENGLFDVMDIDDRAIVQTLETRRSGAKAEETIKKIGLDGWFKRDPMGYSGGIWILWRKDRVVVDVVKEHHQFVHVKLNYGGNRFFYCSCVYGSLESYNREELWSELGSIGRSMDGPWIVGGDVNAYRTCDEKVRGVKERLDRVFANLEWSMDFKEAEVIHLFSRKSDHKSMLLRLRREGKKKKLVRPFRFLVAWSTDPRLNDFLEDSWDDSKGWCLASKEFIDKDKLWKEYKRVLEQEELLWCQKARVNWLKHGNRNSKFCHASTVIKRRRNRVNMLKKKDGDWVKEDDILKDMAVNYYENLFIGEVDKDVE